MSCRRDHIESARTPQLRPRISCATDLKFATVMHIRTRKLIGTIALLVLVVVWALLAMGFAQMLPLSRNHLIEIAYYVIAGLGWVLPAMPLISWMSRPDADAPTPDEQ
jgi:hypothetical protein